MARVRLENPEQTADRMHADIEAMILDAKRQHDETGRECWARVKVKLIELHGALLPCLDPKTRRVLSSKS